MLIKEKPSAKLWDILSLPDTSKSSAFWDMGVDSHINWLLLFSPDEAGELGQHQSKNC